MFTWQSSKCWMLSHAKHSIPNSCVSLYSASSQERKGQFAFYSQMKTQGCDSMVQSLLSMYKVLGPLPALQKGNLTHAALCLLQAPPAQVSALLQDWSLSNFCSVPSLTRAMSDPSIQTRNLDLHVCKPASNEPQKLLLLSWLLPFTVTLLLCPTHLPPSWVWSLTGLESCPNPSFGSFRLYWVPGPLKWSLWYRRPCELPSLPEPCRANSSSYLTAGILRALNMQSPLKTSG